MPDKPLNTDPEVYMVGGKKPPPLPPRGVSSAFLYNGDLLFRYLHSKDSTRMEVAYLLSDTGLGLDKEGTELYQRIIECQMSQDAWHDLGYDWCKDQNVDKCVFHVGIYLDDHVIEIGPEGVLQNPVASRPHYDIVVRFPSEVAARICSTANLVKGLFRNTCTIKALWYPAKREGVKVVKGKTEEGGLMNRKLFKIPHQKEAQREVPDDQKQRTLRLTGGWIPPDALNDLFKENQTLSSADAHTLARPVVCSHFVSAVLYKAQCGGSVHAATEEKYDYIFKMTPAHLLRQAFTKQYLCKGAEVTGMQHQGKMLPEKDLGKLILRGDYYCEHLGFKAAA